MRDDAPEESIHDRLHQSFWKGHPLGHPILGSEETISGMSRDAILDFRQHWYRPSEIIIAAAGGNVAFARLIGLDPAKPTNAQRVYNWKRRGIPASIVLANLRLIRRLERKASEANGNSLMGGKHEL